MRASRRSGTLMLVVGIAVLSACSTVPYSERNRVILLSEASEREMGEEAFQEIVSQSQISSDAQRTGVLKRVGQRIAAVADMDLEEADREPFDWEFTLIASDEEVNAFALPGGKVAFFTGILPICKDEAGIAVVMAHEVAHALARHGGERVSQQLVVNIGVQALASLMSSDPKTQETVAGLLGAGLGVVVVLPFSRKHELEADYIGLMLMAKAGYDPRAAPQFWERMLELSGGEEPPKFLSTHPPHAERIQALNDAVPDALRLYQRATGQKVSPGYEVIRGGY
ncbi:M48 family metallopeptidase [Planctomycetota bacterium]